MESSTKLNPCSFYFWIVANALQLFTENFMSLGGCLFTTVVQLVVLQYPKISPPSKIRPSSFLNEVVAKGAYSLESTPTHLCSSTCCYVKQEVLKKQYEGRHAALLLLRKQAHDKRGIAESLHVQITWARLTACEVGVFLREISQLSKIHPTPSFI